MESTRIQQRIWYYQSLLDETRENKRLAEAQLSDVRTFAARHQTQASNMQEDLVSRRGKLSSSTIDASRVKMMRNLSEGMSNLLDEGNVHLTRMETQKYQIGRVISGLEDRVRQHLIDENSYVATLADLRRQLAVAQAEEIQSYV